MMTVIILVVLLFAAVATDGSWCSMTIPTTPPPNCTYEFDDYLFRPVIWETRLEHGDINQRPWNYRYIHSSMLFEDLIASCTPGRESRFTNIVLTDWFTNQTD